MSKIPMTSKLLIAMVMVLLAGATAFYVLTQDQPRNENYEFVLVAEDLDTPVYMTHAGDERLFIVGKHGPIWIIENGAVLDEPFLDIHEIVGSISNEQGLLSVAFAPDYAESGTFYVYYTNNYGDTVVSRYHVSPDDPNRADPESAEIVLEQEQPYPNHNGGLLKFGPDGYLYIGLGDGGSGGDPDYNGQDLGTWLGKILRIDVSNPDVPYAVPEDNPFVDQADALPEIWAYGLRNPWRFSFDTQTGDLYVADVGQNALEEINFQAADSPGGENYGWNHFEASQPYQNPDALDRDTLVFPVAEYDHGDDCSVTGGYVYRGEALPGLTGLYFYGDYCSGKIWTLERHAGRWESSEFMDTGFNISSFGVDVHQELYLINIDGSLWRLQARTD